MKAPIYVRALSPVEQAGIEAGLRSSNAFTLRRSQILLASSREQRPKEIAHNLGCAPQTIRNAIHAFEHKGLECLKQESSRPKTVQAQFDQARCEALHALLHQSPRMFGKTTSCWTLALAAAVCVEQGLTRSQVSLETIRLALKKLGVRWQRAKHWITSPDPEYARKKQRRDALLALAQRHGWEIGYLDEVWWSRVSQPHLHSWSDQDDPLRLQELTLDKSDPDPKALACYGMLSAESGRMHLRFVSGRPVSQVTNDLSLVGVRARPGAGKTRAAPHLGQRLLACEQTGQNLATQAQSDRAARRSHRQTWRAYYPVLAPHQEPLAEPN